MRIEPEDRVRANRIIGYALRDMRERGGITQSQVAQQLHCSQAFISEVESGSRSIKLVEAIVYSHGIGVSSQELYQQVKDALANEGLLPRATQDGSNRR